MIRNDEELQQAKLQIADGQQRLKRERAALRAEGLEPAEIRRAVSPVQAFLLQLQEEMESYERLLRGEFDELKNFAGVGRLLVTQRELAERLGVHESQVSRDERNEYHGVSIERASRILEALGANVRTVVEPTELVRPVG
jgi:hypothetical protein